MYADVNDVTPMRNVTAAGLNEKDNNFSQWTFTYTQDYQLIKLGENELTAKISCSDNGVSMLSIGKACLLTLNRTSMCSIVGVTHVI